MLTGGTNAYLALAAVVHACNPPLFVMFASPPPETVAVLVTEAAANCATFTVIEMAGNDPLLATTAVLVQVTICATIPQVQPLPDAAVGVSPAGSVSVTVVVPLVAAAPMLLTVNA